MLRDWLAAPRQLWLVFLAVMLLLTSTLGCLGWSLLAQERQLAHRLPNNLSLTAASYRLPLPTVMTVMC